MHEAFAGRTTRGRGASETGQNTVRVCDRSLDVRLFLVAGDRRGDGNQVFLLGPMVVIGLALLLAAYSSRVYRDAKLLRPSSGQPT